MPFPEFERRLGYAFRDEQLLRLALTHPSVAREVNEPAQHNQRLEFLGDAVLQLVLTRELYEKFPGFGEGPLTRARAKLVNRSALAERARAIDLGPCLILSRGEELQDGRNRTSSLADGFEALVGAIFLDGGFEVVREFILREFSPSFGELDTIPVIENPKGELQELLQPKTGQAPQYRTVSTTGPDHDPIFECTVHHDGVELARGRGKSKKAAESEAALAALNKLREESA